MARRRPFAGLSDVDGLRGRMGCPAGTVPVVERLTYDVDLRHLGPDLRDRFVQFDVDAGTRGFLTAEQGRRHGRLRWTARGIARSALGAFAANALFNTYPLFLLSAEQWRALLGAPSGGHLLDIGAATGDVTEHLRPLFDSVTATDVSRLMVRRLRQRGFDAFCVDVASSPPPGGRYDTVSLLNVLDRCSDPMSLLRRSASLVPAHGRLVVSMPLPYAPLWYSGPRDAAPRERLPIGGRSWEDAASSLAALIESIGFELSAMTRAPYISGGDRRTPIYVLDAAVFVATRPASTLSTTFATSSSVTR